MYTKCKGCGKQLDMTKGGTRCEACRQKKSRDKKMAQPRAYAMGFQVDQWSKMLTEKTITTDEARELLNAVWDRLGSFYDQIKAAEAVQAAKATKK